MSRQGMPRAMLALVGFDIRNSIGCEPDKTGSAVDAGRRFRKKFRLREQSRQLIQNGINPAFAEFDARRLAFRRFIISTVIEMRGQAQFMFRNGFPMRITIAPELAFGINNFTILLGQILMYALGDLDIRTDKNRARIESVSPKEDSASNRRAHGICSRIMEQVVKILAFGRRGDGDLIPAA